MPAFNRFSLSRILLSTTLLLGATTLASPAQASNSFAAWEHGGVTTLAYKTLGGAVASYRTELRGGAQWLVLDLYYAGAKTETKVRVGPGNFSGGAYDYVISASGVSRNTGTTSATGSRGLDGQHFHVEIPLAEAAGLGGGELRFVFDGASAGVSSFMHPVPPPPAATVSATEHAQCESELSSVRSQLSKLEAELRKAEKSKAKTKTKGLR